MRFLIATAAAFGLAVGYVSAGDVEFKPIDTNKLVVKPSRAVASITEKSINLVGNTAAGSLEGNGYVKTINNLFGFRKSVGMPTQAGRSALPAPQVFQSTQYRSYNAPVMPTARPR